MPQRGIHGALETSCIPPSLASNDHQRPADSRNSSEVTTSAVHLALRSSPRRTGTTPARGRRMSAWRIHWLKWIEARRSLIGESPDHGLKNPQCPDQEEHYIDAHLPCLQPAP